MIAALFGFPAELRLSARLTDDLRDGHDQQLGFAALDAAF
ncbi:MAG: hypothetical protein RhofKO_34770 [Rhodothermales bacterium]